MKMKYCHNNLLTLTQNCNVAYDLKNNIIKYVYLTCQQEFFFFRIQKSFFAPFYLKIGVLFFFSTLVYTHIMHCILHLEQESRVPYNFRILPILHNTFTSMFMIIMVFSSQGHLIH